MTAAYSCVFGCVQAHSLTERIHDIDLQSLDAQSVAEVRQTLTNACIIITVDKSVVSVTSVFVSLSIR